MNRGAGAARLRADAASLAPLACAVHCVVAPVLAFMAPALVHSALFEGVLLTGAAGVAAAALVAGTRVHGRKAPWLPVGAGASIWLLLPAGALAQVPEAVIAGGGGVVMFAGLRWNARLRAASESGECGCPSCAYEDRA